MEGFFALLIMLGIGLVIAGPVAVILAIVLFNKLGNIQRRLNRLEGKTEYGVYGIEHPKPVTYERKEPSWGGTGVGFAAPQSTPTVTPETKPVSPPMPEQLKPTVPHTPPPIEPQKPVVPIMPISEKPKVSAQPPQFIPPAPATPKSATPVAPKTSLEVKIGVKIVPIIAVIIVIIGVGFSLKYIYDHQLMSNVAKLCTVAVGGLVALVIGEVTRRRQFEIVAKCVTALGFALLYAAVFSGNKVYGLIDTPLAFLFAIMITAAAMAYAVWLDEVIIAFLSLLGGFLSPILITTERVLPVQLFGYVLVVGLGAMACAAFRRWRAVNWMAFAGTFVLYTLWFEKFYRSDQTSIALIWLGVFGGLYLAMPVLYGLMRKAAAHSEDVGLIVVNSMAVFYYLWRMLYADYQKELGLAAALLGLVHLLIMILVVIRCRNDVKLQSALGVLGTGFITAAIPLYFARVNPTLIGWAIEAAVLTFIAIRYQSLWLKLMSMLAAGIATVGLFYHLPLHDSADFKVILNAPFGTWIFVGLSIMLCHALWRFMRTQTDQEAGLLAQVYFVWGRLLLAVGLALEWYAHCDRHIIYVRQGEAYFLLGMMVIAAILFIGFLIRPICPKGDFVRTVGVMAAVAGSIFVAMAMMGVYYYPFKLFINLPVAIAAVFTALLFFGAWRVHRTVGDSQPQQQIPGAIVVMGLILIFVLLSEQMYSYWYCQNEYGPGRVAGWDTLAHQSMFISWAGYGLVILAAGIRYDKMAIKALGMLASGFSAAGLFLHLPLHNNGDFRFVVNMPFLTWVCVSAAILMGHALWRFMRPTKGDENPFGSQIYYTTGGLLLALGCVLEWYAHCRWQISVPDAGRANFMLGCIIMCIVFVSVFLALPLPPAGLLVKAVGLLASLGGAIYTAYAMNEVYYRAFTVFTNVPFGIASLYVAMILGAAWYMKRLTKNAAAQSMLSSLMVLADLILLWVLLSEQIYQFWYCGHRYGDIGDNWRFLAQMYMSVSWAIYAAVLLVIGFALRTRGVRYLSLVIFAVLLAKINLDIWHLRTEYRIATFLTTGLILVGVSFLYQFLKKRGFFETLDNKKIENV